MGFELYHEMFDRFRKASTKEDKIQILRTFALSRGGSRLPEFLNLAFNPQVVFDVSTIPVYKPSVLPEGLNDAYLHQELGKLYLFIQDHPRRVKKLPEKKEQMILRQILSYLHASEAAVLVALFQKKISTHVSGLTASLSKEAFPQLPFVIEEKRAESSVNKKGPKTRGAVTKKS